MKISIAMATYNGEAFLQEQLDSLASQTCLPCELVVGDDGSTDRTLEILDRFSRSAPFPVLVHRNEKNLGYGDNFLSTAARCSGEWIAFCDQDDVWDRKKLQEFRDKAMHHPGVDWMSCRFTLFYERETRFNIFKSFLKRKLLSPPETSALVNYYGHSIIFKRKFIDLPWETRPVYATGRTIAHDLWLGILGSVAGQRLLLEECLTLFRRHQQATSYNGISLYLNARKIDRPHKEGAGEHFRITALLWTEIAQWCRDNIAIREDFRITPDPAEKCTMIANWYEKRAKIHGGGRGIIPNLQDIALLLRAGAYKDGFGWPPLLKDVRVSLTGFTP